MRGIKVIGGKLATDDQFTMGVAMCEACGVITRLKIGGYDVDGRELHAEWHRGIQAPGERR